MVRGILSIGIACTKLDSHKPDFMPTDISTCHNMGIISQQGPNDRHKAHLLDTNKRAADTAADVTVALCRIMANIGGLWLSKHHLLMTVIYTAIWG